MVPHKCLWLRLLPGAMKRYSLSKEFGSLKKSFLEIDYMLEFGCNVVHVWDHFIQCRPSGISAHNPLRWIETKMEPPCIKFCVVVNSVIENFQSINNELIHLWMLNVSEAVSWWANSRCGRGRGLIAGEAVKYSFYTFSKLLFQSRNIFPKGLSIVLNSQMKCRGGGERVFRTVLPTSNLSW